MMQVQMKGFARQALAPAVLRRCRRASLLLLAALLAGRAARAAPAAHAPAGGPPDPAAHGMQGEPWDGRFFTSPPGELAAAAAALSPREGAPVAMLFYEVRLSFDDAGRMSRTVRRAYRIVDANSDPSWSEVAETWLPWHQNRPQMRARVVAADGQEHRLDPHVLAEAAAGGKDPVIFEDRRLLRGPLPAIGAGAVVEEEETVVDSAPLFDRGVVVREELAMQMPVAHARLEVEAPAGMPLRYASRLLPAVAPQRATSGGRQRLVFDFRPLPAAKTPPPGLPPEASGVPEIELATAASWQDVAQAYSQIVDRSLAGADLAAWLHETSGAGADQAAVAQSEMIAHLVTRMDAIRYTGVELGEGEIVPRRPDETLSRRFGDCKDKAVLLVAALRALDIPAYVALLAAGETAQGVDPALPGFGAFNHAIVFVPGSPPLWIDPTDPFARSGDLPTGDQGRRALVAAPGVSALLLTPVAPASENAVVKTREFFLADLGPARVVETYEYAGEAERREREIVAGSNAEELRKANDEHAQKAFAAKAVAASEHSDPRDLSRPFKVRLEILGAGRGWTDDANAVVSIFYSTLFDYLPDDLDADADEDGAHARPPRQDDYYFDLPYVAEVRYHIVLPAGFEAEELPPPLDRRLGTASLSERFGIGEKGAVTAVLRFDTGKQRLSPAEHAALRTEIGKLLQEKALTLKFRQIGETQVAAGHIREALSEFRSEAAAAPGKAMPHIRTAGALLAGGLGEAALREARRAVAIEPQSAAAHNALGWALQHDALGRRFGKGYQRDAALAAYAKAKQLDSTFVVARADRAILLERGLVGTPYGPGCDLKAAIGEYQGIVKDLNDHSFDVNLLLDLFYDGRLDEARELASSMTPSATTRTVLIAVMARQKGAEAAIREAERTTVDTAARLEMFTSAAGSLVRLGAYDAAAALLEHASPLSADASTLRARAQVLHQVRPLAELPLPAGQPATVARQALIYLARSSNAAGEHDQPPPIFSEAVLGRVSADGEAVVTGLQKLRRKERIAATAAGMPIDELLAITFAAEKELVSGDDATGYRVDFMSKVGEAVHDEFFVVRETAGYRVAATSSELPLLGIEALHRLAAGDLRAARQWLDWARELTPEPSGDPPVPAFPALWTRGVQASDRETRCAAAALAAPDFGEQALPVIAACRAAETDAARQVELDSVLALVAARARRWPDLADLTQRMVAAKPQAKMPFRMATTVLMQLHRTDDAVELARRRLEGRPGDPDAQEVLAYVDESRGDLAGAEKRLRQLAADGTASGEQLNALAWLLMTEGRADEQTLELAQRAAQIRATHGVLHTLAAVLAEGDKASEAYKVLLKAIDDNEDAQPVPEDWYVLGRIAERYGLPDEARTLYARVTSRPDAPEPDAESTYSLARRRLAALAAPR
jgi:tetratricopeptide (TPR) repeat protein